MKMFTKAKLCALYDLRKKLFMKLDYLEKYMLFPKLVKGSEKLAATSTLTYRVSYDFMSMKY
jgi:hypothetical protein